MNERIIVGSTLLGFVLTAVRARPPLPAPQMQAGVPGWSGTWQSGGHRSQCVLPWTASTAVSISLPLSAFQHMVSKSKGWLGGQGRIPGGVLTCSVLVGWTELGQATGKENGIKRKSLV